MKDQRQSAKKFASVEELEAAYEALEAAFTKRCQSLAALKKRMAEQEEEAARAQSGMIPESVLKEREESFYAAAKAEAEAFLEEERVKAAAKTAEILQSEEWKNLAVEEYLRSLGGSDAPLLLASSSGSPSLTPCRKPKTLREAKALADYLLSRI